MKKIIVTLLVALFAVPTFCVRSDITGKKRKRDTKQQFPSEEMPLNKKRRFKDLDFMDIIDTEENDFMDIDIDTDTDSDESDFSLLSNPNELPILNLMYGVSNLNVNDSQKAPDAPTKSEKFKRICPNILRRSQRKLHFE